MSREKGNRLKALIRPQDILLCPSLSAVRACNNSTYEACIASYKCLYKKSNEACTALSKKRSEQPKPYLPPAQSFALLGHAESEGRAHTSDSLTSTFRFFTSILYVT